MKKILSLSLLTLVMTYCSPAPETPATDQTPDAPEVSVVEESQEPQKQLRHVVLFKFKEGTTPEEIATVEQAFADLPAKIPQISGFEWGINNSPEGLDKGFTHCFFLSFNSEEDRATYLPHPDHAAFGEVLTPFLEDVLVLDYWTD